jgi:hypothetical protein
VSRRGRKTSRLLIHSCLGQYALRSRRRCSLRTQLPDPVNMVQRVGTTAVALAVRLLHWGRQSMIQWRRMRTS